MKSLMKRILDLYRKRHTRRTIYLDLVLLGAAAVVWSIVLILIVKLIQVIWFWIGGV